MIERDELAAWLRLLLAPGVGREQARGLLRAAGSPERVRGLPVAEGIDAQVERTLAWLHEAPGRAIVTLGDAAYPGALLQTADPPLLLFAHGRLGLLQTPALAIVGSRNPTAQGADNARAFAAHLARAGFTIVSGLALGIDGAAHEGALDADGDTIAVIGTGIDIAYPRRHEALTRRIAERGLIVSEFPLGTPPLAANFPLRNRIIAGLGCGTLVVEAAVQSGSLITARLAAEAGREVFAIPGSIHAPQSRGCHALIKQGAKLVESAADVLDELQPRRSAARPVSPTPTPSPSPEPEPAAPSDPLLEALGHDPATLDALIARTGWPAAALGARLLELELQGHVERLPGGLFQRRAAA